MNKRPPITSYNMVMMCVFIELYIYAARIDTLCQSCDLWWRIIRDLMLRRCGNIQPIAQIDLGAVNNCVNICCGGGGSYYRIYVATNWAPLSKAGGRWLAAGKCINSSPQPPSHSWENHPVQCTLYMVLHGLRQRNTKAKCHACDKRTKGIPDIKKSCKKKMTMSP